MSATSTLNRIENTFEGWLKPLPHLPENGRKWIANNVWWIVLVGLVISVFATFSLISAILAAIGLMGTMSSYLAAYGVTVYTPMYIASTVVPHSHPKVSTLK